MSLLPIPETTKIPPSSAEYSITVPVFSPLISMKLVAPLLLIVTFLPLVVMLSYSVPPFIKTESAVFTIVFLLFPPLMVAPLPLLVKVKPPSPPSITAFAPLFVIVLFPKPKVI